MSVYDILAAQLRTPAVQEQLAWLYGADQLNFQTERYARVLRAYEQAFGGDRAVEWVSAPGRTEIGGNHTDHNKGKVLAAAVNLDTLAAVTPRDDLLATVCSEGYPPITVDLADLTVHEEEKGTTAALVRGVAARMREMGCRVGGFDAAVTSTVASGSGLSSSAAFEVMTAGILDQLYNGFSLDYKARAVIGQYAENVYFGKPSGLLDQMASAAGGLVTVDFGTPGPDVRPMAFDFAAKGYALVVVGTGGSHADLTDAYAAIPEEMHEVAALLGAEHLRGVSEEAFLEALPSLHGRVSDRALLRALHFYGENRRVENQVAALEADDLPRFFGEILASGRSSFMYLQNVYAVPREQGLSLALALAERMLSGRGAWRVHGGGFAGTTLNFVPADLLDAFTAQMEAVFGKGCCHALNIRPTGAYVLRTENA